ncbi:MAG: HAMP domain-containing protein [Lachnospiraceae bacterium]|nr:HAMP domain-containing protein [Lachnospiraceae bacterium]
MKFRYKVLVINIILLSVGLGFVGFFMIRNNFKLALESQIRSAVEENNVLQSAVEYSALGMDSTASKNAVSDYLSESADKSFSNITSDNTIIYVCYDGETVYTNSQVENDETPKLLISDEVIGKKRYILTSENGGYHIIVSSFNNIDDVSLNVISKKDISFIYEMMNEQKNYFRMLLIVVVVICSAAMMIISSKLTGPLESLEDISGKFGEGDLSVRADIKTGDEVESLANSYNAMAESIEDHIEELKQMIERKEQFVADFTHELKTPMTSIIGYADMIRSKELKRDDQILAADYIFSEGKRLEAMSGKLFDFLYAGKRDIEKKPFSVDRLFERVEKSVEPHLKDKNISLKTECENASISGDIELLSSSLINLIDNARKASSEGSTICFFGKSDQSYYIITVEDQGVGIPREHLDKICNEFYMVDKSRSRKEGGAGLGLSLALEIVKAHKGTLNIESEVGKGTRVIVKLPVNDMSEERTDE